MGDPDLYVNGLVFALVLRITSHPRTRWIPTIVEANKAEEERMATALWFYKQGWMPWTLEPRTTSGVVRAGGRHSSCRCFFIVEPQARSWRLGFHFPLLVKGIPTPIPSQARVQEESSKSLNLLPWSVENKRVVLSDCVLIRWCLKAIVLLGWSQCLSSDNWKHWVGLAFFNLCLKYLVAICPSEGKNSEHKQHF